MRPPCEYCGRGMWRWRAYLVRSDERRQVLVRPFKWRWSDVLAKQSRLSGYRKLYSRWILRGPLEIRTRSNAPKRPLFVGGDV